MAAVFASTAAWYWKCQDCFDLPGNQLETAAMFA